MNMDDSICINLKIGKLISGARSQKVVTFGEQGMVGRLRGTLGDYWVLAMLCLWIWMMVTHIHFCVFTYNSSLSGTLNISMLFLYILHLLKISPRHNCLF